MGIPGLAIPISHLAMLRSSGNGFWNVQITEHKL